MKMFLRFAFLATSILFFGQANALIFSVDPASPVIDGNITPDDILAPGPTGPIVVKQGTALGLKDNFFGGDFDNLDALSKGDDPIKPPLYFSVDRVAVGLPGNAVYAQAQPGVEEAAGDIFQTLPPVGSNTLTIDEQQLGLTPGFFGDDLDALDWSITASSPIYFSIDSLSASNDSGNGDKAANIYVDNISTVRHYYYEMGLDFNDDLDALVYDAIDDIALFSLSTFSVSTFTFTGLDYQAGEKYHLSPADILWTDFNGSFSLWASAAGIGLLSDDNVDALETTPEPGSLALLSIGLICLLARRRKCAEMTKA